MIWLWVGSTPATWSSSQQRRGAKSLISFPFKTERDHHTPCDAERIAGDGCTSAGMEAKTSGSLGRACPAPGFSRTPPAGLPLGAAAAASPSLPPSLGAPRRARAAASLPLCAVEEGAGNQDWYFVRLDLQFLRLGACSQGTEFCCCCRGTSFCASDTNVLVKQRKRSAKAPSSIPVEHETKGLAFSEGPLGACREDLCVNVKNALEALEWRHFISKQPPQ